VLRLMEDAELRERLGRNGRKVVERDYDWNVLADRAADWYERVAKAGRSAKISEAGLAAR
jgi:glycosyltransferase involved in cell wall biosynthesis